jgi:hypothetical protein
MWLKYATSSSIMPSLSSGNSELPGFVWATPLISKETITFTAIFALGYWAFIQKWGRPYNLCRAGDWRGTDPCQAESPKPRKLNLSCVYPVEILK